MSLFHSLSHRPFALLWAGQTVSRLGDSFYLVALAWWVLVNTGSAAAMGTVLICESVPLLVFLLVGGVAVDRFPRLYLMLVSDLTRALVVGSVALLAALHLLQLWHLFVMSALFGLVDAFFYPAYEAVVPEIVSPEALASANSLRTIGGNVSGLAGPALAASMVALGGTSLAFGIDALTFVLSAGCIMAASSAAALHRADASETGVIQDLREGIGAVLGSPWVWIGIAVAGVSNITLSGPLDAVLPFLIKLHLHAGVGIYGLTNSLEAAGSILVAVWLGHRRQLRHRGPVMYGAWIIAALMVSAMGLSIGVPGVLLAIFVSGGALGALNLVWANILPVVVPRDLLGRVNSIDLLGSAGLTPIGLAGAGFAADRIGPSPVFVIGGAISAGIISLAFLHPAVRHLD
ncbi:MAG: MFS transporter [Dehalococcoidia bacterium]